MKRVGEMVQNSQIQYSFTCNDFIFVHDDIHSHSTTTLSFNTYTDSHLTTYFFVTNIFIYIRHTYLQIYSFTFATDIHSHSRSKFSFNTVNSFNILCAPSLRIIQWLDTRPLLALSFERRDLSSFYRKMSSHRNDLESIIGRCVREEMRTFDFSGAQSLLNRTRHLIQEASMSVVKNMRRWGITRFLHLVVLEVIWPKSLRDRIWGENSKRISLCRCWFCILFSCRWILPQSGTFLKIAAGSPLSLQAWARCTSYLFIYGFSKY